MEELRERIRGALIGIAYGDAFGMPGEMWTPEMIRQKLGTIREFRCGHPENSISAGLKRGEATDDTVNSMLVLEMLCENHGKTDAAAFIEKLDEWVRTSDKSSAVVGPSTARAIELIRSGVPMEETGKNGTTNGGAMKILPVGLAAGLRARREEDGFEAGLRGNDGVAAGPQRKQKLDSAVIDLPKKQEFNNLAAGLSGKLPLKNLTDEVAKLCMPTHNTSCAISAACAIAAGGALAVYGERSIERIFAFMQEAAAYGERYGFAWGGPSVAGRMEMGKYFADHYPAEEALKAIYTYVGTGIASAESIPAAAALFYLSKGNPDVCARYAANLGGDTDTIGAMACGICGAYSGADAFQPEDVALLEEVNNLSFSESEKKLTESICG